MKVLIQNTKDIDSQRIIVSKINERAREYVQNAYANFVVSEVLAKFEFEVCKDIFNQMKGYFAKFSLNKFSSQFIEVCIKTAPLNLQEEIIDEYCQS